MGIGTILDHLESTFMAPFDWRRGCWEAFTDVVGLDVGTDASRVAWQAMAGPGDTFGGGDILALWRQLGYDFDPGDALERSSFDGPGFDVVFRR